jgi:hypothetical protein
MKNERFCMKGSIVKYQSNPQNSYTLRSIGLLYPE